MTTLVHTNTDQSSHSRPGSYPLAFRLAMHLKGALKILGLRKQEPLLPRLLFMGADPGDTLRTLAAVHTPEEWPLRWCLLAQQYEERGQEALAHKHLVSAADTLRLAAIYYRIAEYMVTNHDERVSIWRKLVHCYQRAGRLFTPPLQVLPVHSNGARHARSKCLLTDRCSTRTTIPVIPMSSIDGFPSPNGSKKTGSLLTTALASTCTPTPRC